MSIAPWSFSRLKSFEQCPKQFYHMKIAKDYSEPETDAMRYGTEAHLAAEEFIRDGKPDGSRTPRSNPNTSSTPDLPICTLSPLTMYLIIP